MKNIYFQLTKVIGRDIISVVVDKKENSITLVKLIGNLMVDNKQRIRIVDAHHHIWKIKDLDWLKGPTQPRIFGDYSKIKKDYLISDFLMDLQNSGVEKSVYIQVNWPAKQEIIEAEWVQEVANEFGWPNAIIGYVDFSSEESRKTMNRLNSLPLMRGVRQQLHWHQNPLYCFQPTPDLMLEKNWQKNFALIQDFGWTFELQVFSSQMKNASLFAKTFPDIKMMLQHCGMPEDTSDAGMEKWREGMKRLAEHNNIYCKFSGLGTFIHKNDPNFISDITGECLEMFGNNRCIFGSNYPIEKIWSDYDSIVKAFIDSTAKLSKESQLNIMRCNAEKFYNLA